MRKRRCRINLFYVPAIVLILLFVVYPLGNAIYISFLKWNGYSQTKNFIGFNNYLSLIKDENFRTAFFNTLLYGFGCTILQNIFGLLFALFLNSKFKGRSIVRTVIYLPAIISGLVMGYIMYFFFQYKNGVVNEILSLFGIVGNDWLSVGMQAKIIMALINVWQFVGLSMVIYLAGLQGISKMYYEAAAIDGATKWKQFTNITLPLLNPAIASAVLLNLIGGLKLFEIIKAMTNGGPGFATHSLATYLTNQYFDAEKAGYAGAIGVFLFVFIMLIAFVLNSWFRNREVEM